MPRSRNERKSRNRNKNNDSKMLAANPSIPNEVFYGHSMLASPMQNSMRRITKYFDRSYTLNPGAAGIAATHVFAANALYDVDITGTGHQPLAFDNLMTFYNHWTVLASRIRVTFENMDTTYSQIVGIRLSDSNATDNDPRVYVENAQGPYQLLQTAGRGGKEIATLENKFNAYTFFNTNPNAILNDTLFRGDSSGNNSELAYYLLWAAPLVAVDSGTVQFMVEIDYDVVFYNPKALSLS